MRSADMHLTTLADDVNGGGHDELALRAAESIMLYHEQSTATVMYAKCAARLYVEVHIDLLACGLQCLCLPAGRPHYLNKCDVE